MSAAPKAVDVLRVLNDMLYGGFPFAARLTDGTAEAALSAITELLAADREYDEAHLRLKAALDSGDTAAIEHMSLELRVARTCRAAALAACGGGV